MSTNEQPLTSSRNDGNNLVSSSNALYECKKCIEKAAEFAYSVSGVQRGCDVDFDIFYCNSCGAEYVD